MLDHTQNPASRENTLPPGSGASVLAMFVLLAAATAVGCGGASADAVAPPPQGHGTVAGVVRAVAGAPYPNVVVRLTTTSGVLQDTTSVTGSFSIGAVPVGSHLLNVDLPPATTAATALPRAIQVSAAQTTQADVEINVVPVLARLNVGTVDIFGEVVNAQGIKTTNSPDLLFAKNVFDPPLGLLTEITNPNGRQLTLAEWSTATGQALTRCNGPSATVALDLSGLVPGGTYSFWLNFLRVRRVPGDPINPATDLIRILPLGSGTTNVAVADAQGGLRATVTHASCILTDAATVVMPVIYHIRGNTFGAAHIPDPEEVTQLLFYF